MSIYGESMSLVTEGKLIDKFKKTLNKFKTKYKKWSEKYTVDDISDEEMFFADTNNFSGHLEFFKKYFRDNYNELFCRLDVDKSESYMELVKSIFGTDDFRQIHDNYSSYLRNKKYTYSEKDDTEIAEAIDYIGIAYLGQVQRNINTFENSKDKDNEVYQSAVLIQSQLIDLLALLANQYAYERDVLFNNYKRKRKYVVGL